MVECNDFKEVKRAAQGDEAAFATLVVKYQGRIANLLYRYIGSQVDLEDVVQEVFIKVYKGLHNFRYDCSFYTWLYRIAINTAKNHLMKLKKLRANVDFELVHVDASLREGALYDEASPERVLQEEELKAVIDKAIEALSIDLKSVLLLREMSGLGYGEIADILECPVGTVRSRLFRAREFVSVAISNASGESTERQQVENETND